MTDEEKKAIENLKFCLTTNGEISIYDGTTIPVKITDIQILLNLLSKKDKVIDLIITDYLNLSKERMSKEEFKKWYFDLVGIKKVEGKNEL